MLQAVTRRLEALLRTTDTITRATGEQVAQGFEHTLARIGGDEFIILLNDVRNATDTTRVTERVHQALARPFQLAGRDVFVTVSIGVAVSATGYTKTDDVLRDAEIAMNRAKALGKGRSEVFDAAMRERAVERLRLDSELRPALRRHEFVPHFQPIIDLRTGRLAGFEALLRWGHPQRGIVPPAQFLSLVEENGLLLPIGRRFYQDVCRQHRRWLDAHSDAARLSINVNFATGQLLDAALPARLLEAINEAGLEPGHSVVEITESTAVQNLSMTADVLLELREAGVKVVLDDFGTGYSSLACLHQLPISGLKLDPSFIGAADQHPELIRAVLVLSSSLGLTVTAEGIETTAQYGLLRALGCDLGQGYLFAQPLRADQASELIAAETIFVPDLCLAAP